MTANRQILSARVAEWDRQKGYGFLDSGRERIFLHRRDFVKWHRPPATPFATYNAICYNAICHLFLLC